MSSQFSFVTKDRKSIELLQSPIMSEDSDAAITLEILETSLTANNKFYLKYGNKTPFYFDKCYPVDTASSKLVLGNKSSDVEVDDHGTSTYIHPPVWGICQVTKSSVEGAPVGTRYTAMLPMARQVSFEKAHVVGSGDLVIHRPTTNSAYNVFRKLPPHEGTEDFESMKLVCGVGYLTGFGLYFALEEQEWYGCDAIVLTSASSKVSLSLAFYIKQAKKDIPIVGYTSASNKSFCESTGLYDTILQYDETLPNSVKKCVMVDVAGNAKPFLSNKDVVTKLLVVGNSSGSADKASIFSHFSLFAATKMMFTLLGSPSWLSSWMNPTQELFLIMNTMKQLEAKWGLEKLQKTQEEHTVQFCEAAGQWIRLRRCVTEESIKAAFAEIVAGTVKPSEAIVMDVRKATEELCTDESL